MKVEFLNSKLKYLFIIFLIGGFFGFVYEFLFYMFVDKIIYNPGALYGPLIPIYGIGTVFLLPLKNVKNKPFLFFLLSMIITGIVELIGGIICIELFHKKLWSYDGLFLNINGIVCFRSVFSFAIGSTIFHYYLLPLLNNILKKIDKRNLNKIVFLLTVLFIIDLYVSLKYKTPRIF